MRLVTRADFDGLVCGFLLKEKGLVNSFKFIHPKDLQDGKFRATQNDILANVPFVPGCAFWIDHHVSEKERCDLSQKQDKTKILLKNAPSAAQIIYEYYGGEESLPQYKEVVKAVNKIDSADLNISEIICPADWILLGFIYDPRTGLERHNFKINRHQLTEKLINKYHTASIKEILSLPDIKERIEVYNEQNEHFKKMLLDNTVIKGSLIFTDLRHVPKIYAGNRFLIYSFFPGQNVSCWIVNGKDKDTVSIACGHSIINKTATINIGKLMLKYGGGGLKQAGTCQIKKEKAEQVIKEISDCLQFNLLCH